MAKHKPTEAQYRRGFREESHEHPSFTKKQVSTIVADHLGEHPFMYRK